MSYTPTDWKTGDTIFAEQLNNMESGIVSALDSFVIIRTTGTIDSGGTTIQPIDPLILPNVINRDSVPFLLVELTTDGPTMHICLIYNKETFGPDAKLTGYFFEGADLSLTVNVDGSITLE